MDSPGSLWPQLLILLILIMLNAFYAANETAYVSLNQSKIRAMADDGSRNARRVLQLIELPETFLATMQVITTLITLVIGSRMTLYYLSYMSSNGTMATWNVLQYVAIGLGFLGLALLIIVLGEVYPKQVALQAPEQVALSTSFIIMGTYRLFKPFVWLIQVASSGLRKITPIDFHKGDERFTRDEMKAILSESRDEGSIDLEEFTMLQGVLSLDDKMAREIMVPRTDTFMIDIEDDYSENIAEILSSPFSRIPIYEDDKDNVVGVLHIKHVLKAAAEHGFEHIQLHELASPPLFVPSTIYIDDLLVEFRRAENHMAILRDEYGGVEGIVTMEDVLEEIVGDIEDETDEISLGDIEQIDETHFYINGIVPLDKFNNYFEETLESDEVDTIAGLMIYHLGYVPENDEQLTFRANRYVLTTDTIENGRIRGIRVELDPLATIDTDYNLYSDVDQERVHQELTREINELETLKD